VFRKVEQKPIGFDMELRESLRIIAKEIRDRLSANGELVGFQRGEGFCNCFTSHASSKYTIRRSCANSK
jgi:hypothetical protein